MYLWEAQISSFSHSSLDHNLVPPGHIVLNIEEEETTIEKKSVSSGLSKELTFF